MIAATAIAATTDISHTYNHHYSTRRSAPSTGPLTAITEKITRSTPHESRVHPTSTGAGTSTAAPAKTTTIAAPSALPPLNLNSQRQVASRILPV